MGCSCSGPSANDRSARCGSGRLTRRPYRPATSRAGYRNGHRRSIASGDAIAVHETGLEPGHHDFQLWWRGCRVSESGGFAGILGDWDAPRLSRFSDFPGLCGTLPHVTAHGEARRPFRRRADPMLLDPGAGGRLLAKRWSPLRRGSCAAPGSRMRCAGARIKSARSPRTVRLRPPRRSPSCPNARPGSRLKVEFCRGADVRTAPESGPAQIAIGRLGSGPGTPFLPRVDLLAQHGAAVLPAVVEVEHEAELIAGRDYGVDLHPIMILGEIVVEEMRIGKADPPRTRRARTRADATDPSPRTC